MKYLAIDTSGKNLTVIAKNQDQTEIYFDPNCGVFHSTAVMNKIEETLEKVSLNLKDADFIACVTGAGSFTGIRIGVSTVKALCFANGIKCLPITSFDTIAYNKKAGKVLAVIDAKHDGYYVAGYSDGKLILPPSFVNGNELVKLSEEYKLLSFEEIKGYDVEVVSISNGLLKAVEDNYSNVVSVSELNPLYVRKSQAEEGRP
jgi:tRNA threonylcarbamoyladenosine biosynthesis protein TsaB